MRGIRFARCLYRCRLRIEKPARWRGPSGGRIYSTGNSCAKNAARLNSIASHVSHRIAPRLVASYCSAPQRIDYLRAPRVSRNHGRWIARRRSPLPRCAIAACAGSLFFVPTTNAAIQSRSAPISGPTRSGFPTLNCNSCARRAASAALMSGRISSPPGWGRQAERHGIATKNGLRW
jgi:hypothetical protein